MGRPRRNFKSYHQQLAYERLDKIRHNREERKKRQREQLEQEKVRRRAQSKETLTGPRFNRNSLCRMICRDMEMEESNQSIQVISPQPGPQTEFLSSPADIVVFGGSAGGGKTLGLILDPLRYVHNPNFGAVIFRRTYPEIKKEGGLWDEASRLYLPLGAKSKESDLSYTFPSGAKISFAHLQHEKNIYSWQGSQVPYFGFDELTHFTERQFWYLLSRQRNVAGIPNLCRCTCNPDPDSFVRYLIDWWIDTEGYAIAERSGVIRWFIRNQDNIVWADNKEELLRKFGKDCMPKSLTFIRSKLEDNKILMERDPSYLATLKALPKVDRARLLSGNWNIRPASGLYFKSTWFEIVQPELVPPMRKVCRGWDLAAGESKNIVTRKRSHSEPDATAGVKIGRGIDGNFYILDVKYDKVSPMMVERMVKNCAIRDGIKCIIRLPQDPGQAGKSQINHFAKQLLGYPFKARKITGDKVTRAGAFSSACEYGKVRLVRADWNDLFLTHLEEFPPEFGSPDIVDACVEAFHELTYGGANVKHVVPVSVAI